jgi:hypothetical protein
LRRIAGRKSEISGFHVADDITLATVTVLPNCLL